MKNFVDLDLNCLVEILKQIKNNCELNKTTNSLGFIKFADLISFALTCEWFRNVFWDWDPFLYDRLEIDKTYLSQSKSIILDLDRLFIRLLKSNHKDKDVFFNNYMNALKSNTRLEEIKFRCISIRYHIECEKTVNMLMTAIENNQRIKILNIDIRGKHLNNISLSVA